jgi:anti-sigma-K factor RskA
LIDRLAAEYALGTLRGAARRAFTRRLEHNAPLAIALAEWERRLLPLQEGLAPVAPRASSWQRICLRLSLPANGERAAPKSRRPALALAAAAAALLAIGLGLWFALTSPHWTPVSVVADERGLPVWRIEAEKGGAHFKVSTLRPASARAGSAYELWALPSSGAPVSLGLLPNQGELERVLSARQQDALRHAAKVAVSIEPPGGSPTGAPTGPVVATAPVKT